MKQKLLQFMVPEGAVRTSAILDVPAKARALLTLAHGAGAGMKHPWLAALAAALNERHFATLRFQFPYMEQGKKRTDRPAIATATVAAALAEAAKAAPALPLYVGGKSFGARMTTAAAAEGRLDRALGIVCFGFPLHPAKKPGVSRAAHLARVPLPTLFLQGTRDALADLDLLRPIIGEHGRVLKLSIIEGADHGFGVLKSSGRTGADVLVELADEAAKFCNALQI